MVFCKHCGTKLAPENTFCTNCGKPILKDPIKSEASTKKGSVKKKPIKSKVVVKKEVISRRRGVRLVPIIIFLLIAYVVACFIAAQSLTLDLSAEQIINTVTSSKASVGIMSSELEIDIPVLNPTVIPIFVTRTECDVIVNGAVVTHGRTITSNFLKPSSTTSVEMLFEINYVDAVSGLIRSIRQGGSTNVYCSGYLGPIKFYSEGVA